MATNLGRRSEEYHLKHTVCKRFQTEYKEEKGTNVQINCADKKIVLVGYIFLYYRFLYYIFLYRSVKSHGIRKLRQLAVVKSETNFCIL